MSSARAFVVGIVATAIVSGSVLAQRSWHEPYQKAVDAIKAHKWDEALKQIDAALKMDSKPGKEKNYEGVFSADYFPYFYRGLAYKELRQYEKAEKDFSEAAKFQTVMPPPLAKELDAARRDVALALHPTPAPSATPGPVTTPPPNTNTNPKPTVTPAAPNTPAVDSRFNSQQRAAQAALDGRRFEEAIDLFENLRKLDSNAFNAANLASRLADAQRGRANEFLSIGQQRLKDLKIGEAKARLTDANALVPAIARAELADIDRREKDYRTNKAAGEQSKAAGQLRDALRSYEAANAAHPEMYRADNIGARVDELNRLLLAPTPTPTLNNDKAMAQGYVERGRSLLRQHRYDDALTLFEQANKKDQKNTEAADWLSQNRKYEELKKTGTDLETKNPEGAITALRDAKDIDGDRFAWDKLGVIVDRINTTMRKVDPAPPAIFGPLHDALVAYLSGDDGQVIALLEEPARNDKALDSQTRADVHAYLGVAYADRAFSAPTDDARRKFRDQAVQQFKLALTDKPEYQLSSRLVAPQVQKLLTEAKGSH